MVASPDGDCVIFFFLAGGRGEERTGPPGTRVTVWRPHRNLKKRAESSPGQGKNPGLGGLCTGSFANQKLRGVGYTEGTVGTAKPTQLVGKEFSRVEISAQTTCKRATARARNTGSEHLRTAAAIESPSQTGNPNIHLWITGSTDK